MAKKGLTSSGLATAGYVERPGAQINWGEIGAQISDVLTAEAKSREDKKAAIREESRKASMALNNAPKGQSEFWNGVTSDFVSNAQEQMLMTKRLLEGGQMDLRDYNNIRKNMTDGTALLFENVQKIQDYVAVHGERMQPGGKDGREASNAEAMVMSALGIYGDDVSKTTITIDNMSGVVGLGRLDEKGNLITDPGLNGPLTMEQMTDGLNTFVDKYKMDDEMAAAEKQLGEKVISTVVNVDGSRLKAIEKVTDKTALSDEDKVLFDFVEFEENMINANLSDPMKMLSVLTDYSGEKYEFCFTGDCAGDNKIEVDRSKGYTEYKFSDGQKAKAFDIMRRNFRSKIGYKKEVGGVTEPSRPPQRNTAEIEAGQQAERQADLAKQWASLYYAPNEEKLTTIRSMINNPFVVKEMGMSGFEPVIENGVVTGLDIGYLDNRKDQVIPLDDLESMPYEKWVEIGSFIHGLAREEALDKAGPMPQGAQIDTDFSNTGAKRRGNVNKRKDLFDEWITQPVAVGEGKKPGLGLDKNVFYNDEDVVVGRLNKILPLITGKDGKPLYNTEKFTFQNGFYIKDQGGETLFEFDTSLKIGDKKMQEQYSQLMNFLQTNLSSEKAEILYDRELGDRFIEEEKEKRRKKAEQGTEEVTEQEIEERTEEDVDASAY